MPENSFKSLIIAFILFSLFGMLLVGTIVSMAGTYGTDTTGVIGGAVTLDKFNQTVSNIESDANALQGRFSSGSVWSVLAGVVVEGIFGIAKDMVIMITIPFSVLSEIMENSLGVPYYVTSVILGILIMSIIFAVWRLIRIGD